MKRTKTYQYLEEALLLLLETTKFESITVRDLVEKAGISRTAFYAQFTCKQDFVEQVIQNTNKDATIISTDYMNMDLFSEENFVDYYTRLYQYIHSKHRLYRTMLGENGLPQFREGMRNEATKVWREKHFTETVYGEEDREIILAYIVSAHIGLVEFWLENEMRETPEYMARQLYSMTWRVLRDSTL